MIFVYNKAKLLNKLEINTMSCRNVLKGNQTLNFHVERNILVYDCYMYMYICVFW